jgi:hypothetical protein
MIVVSSDGRKDCAVPTIVQTDMAKTLANKHSVLLLVGTDGSKSMMSLTPGL